MQADLNGCEELLTEGAEDRAAVLQFESGRVFAEELCHPFTQFTEFTERRTQIGQLQSGPLEKNVTGRETV